MNSFIIYLVEVSICLTLFYLVYTLFKGETFYSLKRIYLLFTVILSLIIPQLTTPNLPVDIEQIIVVEPQPEIKNITYQDTFEKVVVGQIPESIFTSEHKTLTLSNMLIVIYLTGVLYLLYRLLKNLLHIFHLYKQCKKKKYLNFDVILLPNEYPTFSFLKFIFLNNKNLTEEDKTDVIQHEIAHIKQKHSLDILFIEFCRILCWFNPIIWFYKSSMVKVHECLADRYFVKNKPNNIDDYQSLLLKQYLSKIHIELAHPFNYSLIKYRIKMMTKNKSKWWAKYKIIFALPVVFIGLMAFSNADLNGDKKSKSDWSPYGMVFIPQGSFVMNRSDGESSVERNITVESFWMKATEVTVKEYFEFLESVKAEVSQEEYQLLLPDFSKAPYENYFTHKKYYNYPVVGVSYKQANLFCIWLTNLENEELQENGRNPNRAYRLPIETEWVYASFGGMQPEEIVKPKISDLAKTGNGKPNEFGLLNMFDNVSEWTANTAFLNYDSLRKNATSNYIVLPPGIEKNADDQPIKFTSPSGRKIEKQFISAKKYLQEDFEPTHKIVRGNNYNNQIPNGATNLDFHQSYDYVGFRYVRSYTGKNDN